MLIDVGRRWLPGNFDVQLKRGFAMPFGSWLRGPLGDVFDDTLNGRSARQRGVLEPSGVERVRDRFRRGETSWPEPWLLMMFELWCREVLDTAGHVSVGSDCART